MIPLVLARQLRRVEGSKAGNFNREIGLYSQHLRIGCPQETAADAACNPKPATNWIPHKRRSFREMWSRTTRKKTEDVVKGFNRSVYSCVFVSIRG